MNKRKWFANIVQWILIAVVVVMARGWMIEALWYAVMVWAD